MGLSRVACDDGAVGTQPSTLTLSEHERRELIIWAVSCVERLLPVFVRAEPNDSRLREALGALVRSRTVNRRSVRPESSPCSVMRRRGIPTTRHRRRQRDHLPARFTTYVYST